MSRTLNSDGLPVVKTRHGGNTNLHITEFAGKKIALIIDCPCGRGDSGELTVQCPTESSNPREYHEVWGLCYACEERVSTRMFFYDVIEVQAVSFTKEEQRKDELLYMQTLENWKDRTNGRILLDMLLGRKFKSPNRSWEMQNNINIDGMFGLDLVAAVRCSEPNCIFGITIKEFIPCTSEGIFSIGGNCQACGKELSAEIHLFRS